MVMCCPACGSRPVCRLVHLRRHGVCPARPQRLCHLRTEYAMQMQFLLDLWSATWLPACRRQLLAFVVCVNACLLLEVLDFPPLMGIFDSHSLWHLATVPLTYFWYEFIFRDHACLTSPPPTPKTE